MKESNKQRAKRESTTNSKEVSNTPYSEDPILPPDYTLTFAGYGLLVIFLIVVVAI